MGNFLTLSSSMRNVTKTSKPLPIETQFKLPSPIPTWPPGEEGFASGVIVLEGIKVCQISTFNKVWATHEGGSENLGATFFEPTSIPQGFYMLGCYSQPNNKPLFGWALAAKEEDPSGSEALKKPLDYTLVWSSESLKIKQDRNGYFWLPTPPEGYKAMGIVVTNSADKPSLEKIRCVRSDLTEECETEFWIWGPGSVSDANGFNVYGLRPRNRGIQEEGVSVGTFIAQNGDAVVPLSIACLKNNKPKKSSMPNLNQIQTLFQAYSPVVYLHPDEKYHPCSVTWFFSNGALLYKKGEESKAVPIDPTGSNLPQGESNDGAYWLDLPVDKKAKERVKKGDLNSTQAYLHIKPMFGATFTDIAIWVFFPFNGPARAKVQLLNVPLGKIGEHVGDWEHITLRISNFTGELHKVYLSAHSGGHWVDASQLEYRNGNKSVAYASLNGHALYSKPGLMLQGSNGIGIRNDSGKSNMVIDTGIGYSIVAAEYLGKDITEPPLVNYFRKWGPNITYDSAEEVKKIEKVLPGKLKSAFRKFVKSLPNELLGEEGPTGPKVKKNWSGDEV